MKVVYLTAGAAGMFCGSCMHDNALAKAMIDRGTDTLLVPTYTPIRTDETNISQDRVFFGGLNIYLQQLFPVLKYTPRWFDSLLNNPRLIQWIASRSMKTSAKQLGALTVSMLHGREGNQRKEVDRLCDWLVDDIQPDALVLTNLLIAGFLPEIKKRLDVPIVVTLQGDDIFIDSLPEPFHSQSIFAMRKLVPYVDRFVVHSEDYGTRMAEVFSIPRGQWQAMPLAIDMGPFRAASQSTRPNSVAPTIGYFARLSPEKGLHVLVDAFIDLHHRHGQRDLKLKLAGWLGPTQVEFWQQQQRKLDQAGLRDSYEYLGSIEQSAKIDFLRSVDLLCVPTVYKEPKGLFALEALACGTPVVLPNHGAFPELLSRTGGGWLVPPENPGALADQLKVLMSNRSELSRVGLEAQAKVLIEGDIHPMADATIAMLQELRSNHSIGNQVTR